MKYLNPHLSIVLILSLFFPTVQGKAQNKNINPDSKGTPWYVDGYIEPKNKVYLSSAEIEKILYKLSENQNLPEKIDHSFSKYMRPVFSQDGGSCGSASRICYMFAYEINNYRNVRGDLPENIYPSHFTWMLTGQNSSKSQMAKFNGVPNSIVYGGETYSKKYGKSGIGWPTDSPDYGWMQGYDKWIHAMGNRIEKNTFISLDNPDNLNILKSWLFNHHGDDTFQLGGVAGAGCAITNSKIVTIPSGLYKADKKIVKSWGPTVDHGTTWSGYDDNVGFDFNEDGKITNNLDITGDGIVDLADWEKGALIMLNSWGDKWANNGTVYVPYRLLKLNNMGAEFYYFRKDYSPKRIMKIKLNYSKRCLIKLNVGIASQTNDSYLEKTVPCHHFIYAGNGQVPLLGKWSDNLVHTEAMEFGIDITDLSFGFDITQSHQYFLKIESKDNADGIGTIDLISIVEYNNLAEITQSFSEHPNETIKGNGATTLVSVEVPGNADRQPDYVYLPQSKLSVHYFDSQEIVGENGRARNAIDGDPETIWHTEWYNKNAPMPHEIQINLNGTFDIAGIQYLPRQIGQNGRISDYEIYACLDTNDWGAPVAAGTWNNTTTEQTVLFSVKKANYLRLKSLTEVNGNPWTSIAELNILRKYYSTTDSQNIEVVQNFELLQNYPNPFNSSTTIKYRIPDAEDIHATSQQVVLKIYDLLGREVTTLVNQKQKSGTYEVKFDASGLSSGIYFYSLKSGGFSGNKKLLYLK